jgi:hypothetical protein
MKKKPEESKKSLKKENIPVVVSAAQLYRDRLSKVKQAGAMGAPGSGMGANVQHGPRGTSPGGSARKNRKGHRPG